MRYLILTLYCALLLATEKSVPETLGIDPTTTKGEWSVQVQAADSKPEKFAIGTEGRYALALLIPNKDLPEHYKKELKGCDVIQVIFGNTDANFIAQFGALTLMHKSIPSKKETFNILLPNPASTSYEKSAIFLYTSPKSPLAQTNEEKLKKTYFSREGIAVFSPIRSESLNIQTSSGTKLNFDKRTVHLDINATLSTPFNPTPSSFRGWVELPLLVPKNSKTSNFVTRYTIESLEKVMPFENKPADEYEQSRTQLPKK